MIVYLFIIILIVRKKILFTEDHRGIRVLQVLNLQLNLLCTYRLNPVVIRSGWFPVLGVCVPGLGVNGSYADCQSAFTISLSETEKSGCQPDTFRHNKNVNQTHNSNSLPLRTEN